jgi:hypothetical protein
LWRLRRFRLVRFLAALVRLVRLLAVLFRILRAMAVVVRTVATAAVMRLMAFAAVSMNAVMLVMVKIVMVFLLIWNSRLMDPRNRRRLALGDSYDEHLKRLVRSMSPACRPDAPWTS